MVTLDRFAGEYCKAGLGLLKIDTLFACVAMAEAFARVDRVDSQHWRRFGALEEKRTALVAAECHRHRRADGLREDTGKAW